MRIISMYTFYDVQTFHGRNWNATVFKNNTKVRTGNNAELMDFTPDMMELLRDNNFAHRTRIPMLAFRSTTPLVQELSICRRRPRTVPWPQSNAL